MVKRGIENQTEEVKALIDACKGKDISLWLHLIFDSEDENTESSINEQLDKFVAIFWQTPTHLDVHKDLHNEEWKRLIREKADSLDIPLRNRWDVLLSKKHTDDIRYIAYKKTHEEIEEWLNTLEDGKSYEIVFHPWKYDPNSDSTRNAEREWDVELINYLYDGILEKYSVQVISQKDL